MSVFVKMSERFLIRSDHFHLASFILFIIDARKVINFLYGLLSYFNFFEGNS